MKSMIHCNICSILNEIECHFVDDVVIQEFLEMDSCTRISDKVKFNTLKSGISYGSFR